MIGNYEYAIETFSLTKVFSDWWGRSRVVAVENLNLQVRPNEVFGLLGPNGSGKTTTIKMLLGLLHPTKGKALILGGLSSNPKISANVGFLPEESYLYPYLSAKETLDFYARLFGLNSKVRQSRIDALLDMVGLSAMANRPVGTFSKGMARRIGLAQALINDPKLLILDEPTSGLDPIGTRQIKDLIVELAKRGKTVLLCSHLLADAEEICDRIAIMYGGGVQRTGNVAELLKQSDMCQITTSNVNEQAIEKIRQILKEQNADCAVAAPMQRLEDLFIDIIRQAQQSKHPTSGAVNRLEQNQQQAAAAVADVLDKLVAAVDTPLQTETKSRQVETIEVKPKEDLLNKLTEEKIETTPVEKQPPQQQDSPQDKINKSVLDELTGSGDSDDK